MSPSHLPDPDVQRQALASAPAPAVLSKDGQIQICGGFWLKRRPDGSLDDSELAGDKRLHDARERVLAALQGEGSEFARAVALWLSLQGNDTGAQAETDSVAARDSVARLASSSTDPKVYAMAFRLCGVGSRPLEGACQLLSAARWAQIDPGNAGP
jgi:hypothetical protein